MCCLWKQAVCNYHCDEWGGIMEVRLGLAPIALSPAPLVIKILSSTNLKKMEFVYSNVLRQHVSSNVLSILNLSGFTVHIWVLICVSLNYQLSCTVFRSSGSISWASWCRASSCAAWLRSDRWSYSPRLPAAPNYWSHTCRHNTIKHSDETSGNIHSANL